MKNLNILKQPQNIPPDNVILTFFHEMQEDEI